MRCSGSSILSRATQRGQADAPDLRQRTLVVSSPRSGGRGYRLPCRRPTMLKVLDLVAQLPTDEHLAIANGIGGGLHDARMAAQCLTDPDPQHEYTAQFLAYLSGAI